MAKMDWSKANHSNSLELGSKSSFEVRKAKKLKQIVELQEENVGKYKKSYVQETFDNSPFQTTEEFEKSIVKSIKEEQEKELNGSKINGHVKLTGGKYRHFNYDDVWNADPDYILWLFWNTPHDFIRQQILRSVPITENVDMYFKKIEMPTVKKLAVQPTWWQY